MLAIGCGSDEADTKTATGPTGPTRGAARQAQRADLLVSADGGVYRARGDHRPRLLFKDAERARWSRDGRLIARQEPGPDPSDYAGQIPELIISRPDGTRRTRLRVPRDYLQRYRIDDFAWGPAQRLVLEATVAGGEEPPSRLFITGPGAREPRELVRCRETATPAWSPDGRSIAYLCADERVEIIRPDGRGRRVVRPAEVPGSVAVGGTPGARATWRPDGHRLALDGLQISDSEERIVLLDPRNGHLASGPAASSLSWSPDGKRIAYTPLSGRGIVVADATTGRPLRRIALKGAYDVDWRPR